MKTLYKIQIILILSLFSLNSFGQFTLSGEIRPRAEFRHGYKTLIPDNADAAFFISQRTRLNLDFKGDKFIVGFSLQNVRTWGDVSQLNKKDINGSAIHQAWGEIIFSPMFSLKVGRQEIAYDDQRIFGSVGWAQQARSHDAAIFKINSPHGCKINIGLAFNQNTENLFGTDYIGVKNYKTLQYLWFHRDFSNFGMSLLFLNNGMAYQDSTNKSDIKQKIAYSQTTGTRLTYKYEQFSFSGSFYFQFGKNADNEKLAASYYAFAFDYKADENFKLGAGMEYLSGNSMSSTSTKDKAFTPFYGTNHKFNGWMDYFYVGNWGGNVGLIDGFIPIKFTKNKVSVALIPHFFFAAADVLDSNGESLKKSLGTEIDFTFGYTFSKSVKIQAGYSQMFATKSLEVLKGGNKNNTNNWAWVMLTFKPTFFKSK